MVMEQWTSRIGSMSQDLPGHITRIEDWRGMRQKHTDAVRRATVHRPSDVSLISESTKSSGETGYGLTGADIWCAVAVIEFLLLVATIPWIRG